jgi:hypothetical protein
VVGRNHLNSIFLIFLLATFIFQIVWRLELYHAIVGCILCTYNNLSLCSCF